MRPRAIADSCAALAAVALAAVAHTEMETAALGLVRGRSFSARTTVAVRSMSGCMCAAAGHLFNAKLIHTVTV